MYIVQGNIGWLEVNLAFILISLVTFFLSQCNDPGYLKSPKNVPFIVRITIFIPIRICCQLLTQSCSAQTVRSLELQDPGIAAFATDAWSALIIIVLGSITVLALAITIISWVSSFQSPALCSVLLSLLQIKFRTTHQSPKIFSLAPLTQNLHINETYSCYLLPSI